MVEKILFVLLAAGIFTWTMPEMEELYRSARYKFCAWFRSLRNEDNWLDARDERLDQVFLEHIRRLLQATLTLGTGRSVHIFLAISILWAGGMFMLSFRQTSFLFALIAAAAGAVIPYLLLICRLRTRRIASSHEGEILITELLNNYKIHYFNMRQAIEITAMTMEEAPNSKRLLLNLAKGLNKAASEREVNLLLAEFRFEIGTTWAGILAEDIYLACSSGIKVTEALSDLAKSMRRARKLKEYTGRENSEAGLILKYFIPVGWLFTVIGGAYFFQLTAEQFFYYQFQTAVGMVWFLIWMLLYIGAWLARFILARRKLDI